MTGHLPRILTLFTLLASTSAAFAQSGRTWVDPPTQDGAQTQTSTPAATPDPAPAADPKPVSAAPSQVPAADLEQADRSNGTLRPQEPSGDSSAQSGIKTQASRKDVAKRRGRTSSRKAAASSKASSRTETVASRRGQPARGGAVVSRREDRSATGRSTRFGRAQMRPGSRLEVMNLRTIQFPDGRRVTILTKPNPDALPEMARPPGY